jgi:hypothetical protein
MEVTMMEGRGKGARALAVLGLTVALMTVGTSGPARAHDGRGAKVIPIDAVAYGSTYGEWAARYWQWVLSIPAATNPGNDTTGEFCAEGQQGPVWFLGSTFTSDPATRHCTVPAGKALFFPIATVISGAGAYDCDPTLPDVPCNIAALRVIAGDATDSVSLEVSIDGKGLRHLAGQHVQTPAFTLTYPEGNVFEAPPGTLGPNVADGYWLMLAPLSAGKHTNRSRALFTGGLFAGSVIEATTYLTVVP